MIMVNKVHQHTMVKVPLMDIEVFGMMVVHLLRLTYITLILELEVHGFWRRSHRI